MVRPHDYTHDCYPNPPSLLQELVLSTENSGAPRKCFALAGARGELRLARLELGAWVLHASNISSGEAFDGPEGEGSLGRLSSDMGASPRSLGEVACSSDGQLITLHSADETLRIRLSDGAFEVGSLGKRLFQSGDAPFSGWDQPQDVWEGLMSPKVTDLSWRSPEGPHPHTFKSEMRRFSYQRPSSFVLGLAGQSGELNRNGYRFELYNTDEFVHTPARRPLYQSWPLLFHRAMDGQHWIAVFVDNPSRTFVDVGDFNPERVTFESVTGLQRVVICVGETLQQVSATMSQLFGGHALPPAWALGYQQSRWSYMSSAEVRAVAARFREENLPCDALYFDIDYMDGARVFTHDPAHFPDLAECVDELRQSGFRSVCIVDPGVKREEGSPLYDLLVESAAVLRKPAGEPFIAKVWPGEVVLPDFGDTTTREVWAQAQAEWLQRVKFDGIWNDMNEPSNFDGQNRTTCTAHTARGEFREESNLYGLWMAAASRLGWEKARPGERPLIISRSGYPGVQRYAVNWQGDNQAWWEHLRLAIDMSIAFSLSGAFYTGADVPGFTGNPPDDLAVRFFQLGTWLPLFRGHSIFFAKDKEPFRYEGVPGDAIRSAITLRYSLAREWYSGFERACREHRSLLFPVWTTEGSLVRDQFLCMDKFLVAPVVERDAEVRTVYLPEGLWYRLGYPQEEPAQGPRWQVLPVSLVDCPVFVRAGSILVRSRPQINMESTLRGGEQYEIYRDSAGAAQGYWYGDDLISATPSERRREILIAEPSSSVVKRERHNELTS